MSPEYEGACLYLPSGQAAIALLSHAEEAVKNYLRNLPFNSILRRTSLVDAVQTVPGVIDLCLTQVKQGSTTIPATYMPPSGHAKMANPSAFTYQTNLIT